MAEPILVRTLDTVVAVDLQGAAAELEESVRRAWSRCLAPDATESGRIEVRLERLTKARRTSSMVQAASPDTVLELLTQAITLAGVEHGAGSLLMLHACGLSDPITGRALALVAASGTGKSTAARHLGVRWGYLSDETVAVRPDGSLVPFPKPLSLLTGSRWKEQVSPDDLGLLRAAGEVSLVGVALLERRANGLGQRVDRPLSEAIASLAPHSSYLPRLDRPLHRLAAVVGPAGGPLLQYSDSEQLEQLLRELVEEAP